MSDCRLPVADWRASRRKPDVFGLHMLHVGPTPRRSPTIRAVLLVLSFLVLASPCSAQVATPRDELLRLVPPDTGVCLVLSDIRGHWPKIRDAEWIKHLRESTLGKVLSAAPETAKLTEVEGVLKKHLDVDVGQLRDDILGDLIVFAYKPGPPGQSQDEQGLALVWARKPDLLAQIVERLNQAQLKSKELKEVVAVDFQGSRYYRRVERAQTHYYFLEGSVFVYSGQESVIRQVIERRRKKDGDSNLGKQLDRAGASTALAALWVNPRAFDADLKQKAKNSDTQKALVLKTFLSYWQALEGIVLAVNLGDSTEVRLTLQARVADLPKAIKPLFTEAAVPSELWSRFPPKSILRIVNRINTANLLDTVADLTPGNAKQDIAHTIRAALDLDLVKDVLPNIGPDWGLCIASGPAKSDFPHVLAALAVRPGSGKIAVDRTLINGIRLFADWAVLWYNLKNPEPIRLKKLDQNGIEIQYVANDKVFPSGLQPAFALKDGYLLLASSPEAIGQFQKSTQPEFTRGETPLVDLSLRELAQFLKARRQKVIGFLSSQNQITEETAGQFFDGLMTAFDLFDQLLLSERRQPGQVTWTLRLGNASK